MNGNLDLVVNLFAHKNLARYIPELILRGAEGMAEQIKNLLYNCEDQSLGLPSTHVDLGGCGINH